MQEIVKIKSISLRKLNNSEYTNLMSRINTMAQSVNTEALGVDNQILTEFGVNIDRMSELLSQSYVSDNTAKLSALDKERDKLIVYLMTEFNNKRRSPIESENMAAISLYNSTKNYIGIHQLPRQQETQQITSFLIELNKDFATIHLNALNLMPVVKKLKEINTAYSNLTSQRTADKAASKLDNSASIRDEMDKQYEFITTKIFAQSVSSSSADLSAFVKQLNALISEISSLNKQRLALKKNSSYNIEDDNEE